MPKLLLLILLLSRFPTAAQSQPCNNYACKMELARKALRTGNYKSALDLARGAENYDPSKKAEVNAFIDKVFGAIEGKRREAEEQRKRAEKEKNAAEQATIRAEKATQFTEKQTRLFRNLDLFSRVQKYDHTLSMRMMQYNYLRHENEYVSNVYFQIIKNLNATFAVKIFEDRTYEALSIAYSPDGNKILTCGRDSTVFLWDIDSRKKERIFSEHHNKFYSVAFSSNGKKALALGKELMLWDVESQKPEGVFSGLQGVAIKSAIISSDGKKLLTVGRDGKTVLWSSESRKAEKIVVQSGVKIVALSPDAQKILTSNDSEEVTLWDINNERPDKVFEPGRIIRYLDPVIRHLMFSPNGKMILIGYSDGRVLLWNIENQIKEEIFVGPFYSIIFSPDSEKILTGGIDGLIKLWDINSKMQEKVFTVGRHRILSMTFLPDGKSIIMGNSEKLAVFYDIASLRQDETFCEPDIYEFSFSPDGKNLLTISPGLAAIWNIENNKKEQVEIKGSIIGSSGFSPDGKRVLFLTFDETAYIWDVEKNNSKKVVFGDAVNTYSVLPFFTNDSKCIYVLDNKNSMIKTWDIESHNMENYLNISSGHDYTTFTLSPDRKKLISEIGDGTGFLWDVERDQMLNRIEGESFAFSPDSKKVLTKYSDVGSFLVMWDIDNLKIENDFKIDNAGIGIDLILSPDGKRAFVGGGDNAAMLWNIENGKVDKTFVSGSEIVVLAFSPDGKNIFTRSRDGKCRLWNIDSDCIECRAHLFSLSELRAAGLQLEPEDLLTLWEQGEQLTTDELHLIAKNNNKTKH